jgi:hypothetical protein
LHLHKRKYLKEKLMGKSVRHLYEGINKFCEILKTLIELDKAGDG